MAKGFLFVVDYFIDRIFIILFAAVFSQIPNFINQYLHRLGGHLEEINYQIDSVKKNAALNNKTIEKYINKFKESNDIDFARQGDLFQDLIDRSSFFSNLIIKIKNASLIYKPFVFLFSLEVNIAKSTLKNFNIALIFNLESLIYILAGIFNSLFMYNFLIKKVIYGYIKNIIKYLRD